jgi:hypothetical protein
LYGNIHISFKVYNTGEVMHPGVNGKKFPEKPAVIMAGSGKVVIYLDLWD